MVRQTALIVCFAGSVLFQQQSTPRIVGRWDLTVAGPSGNYTSWLEVETSGYRSLVGRFVGRIGGSRPIGRVEWSNGVIRFAIPPQWDEAMADLRFEGRLVGDSLIGTITNPSGTIRNFTGRRAPSLRRPMPASWSPPVALFNGRDLSGWSATGTPSNWVVRDGVLFNSRAYGANLATVGKFQDFKLHVEFRYPKNGDSGIFLRGRYEVQIRDNSEAEWPDALTTGAIYNFLIPNENAATAAGQWQTMDITLVGRRVTVVLNGKTVIGDQIIPGLSGSALDSDEAAPGPVMLQGEETEVEFRNITISTPSDERRAELDVQTASSCANNDSASAAAVRARLAAWVRQTNAGDVEGSREVWGRNVVGWFPRAPLFSDSAAYAAANLTAAQKSQNAASIFEVQVDDIVARGSTVVVHDTWTETKVFPAARKKAQRTIRSSELWRCEADGRWRIVRYVSAPEPWSLVP